MNIHSLLPHALLGQAVDRLLSRERGPVTNQPSYNDGFANGYRAGHDNGGNFDQFGSGDRGRSRRDDGVSGHHRHGNHGGNGYGEYGGSQGSYGGSNGSYGGFNGLYGSSQGYGSQGSYGGGHGTHGSYGGSNGSYGSYGGSQGSYGGSQGAHGHGSSGWGQYGQGGYGSNRPRPDSECGPGSSYGPNGHRGGLNATKDGNTGTVKTAGGYTIKATSKGADTGGELEITAPDGSKTRWTGDPHVDTQNANNAAAGYQHAFDVKKGTSILLKDGTKLEIKTKPSGGGGASFNDTVNVIDPRSNTGVSFAHLSDGADKLTMETGNGRMLDDMVEDGTKLYWDLKPSSGYTTDNGFGGLDKQVDQAFIDNAEAGGAQNQVRPMPGNTWR